MVFFNTFTVLSTVLCIVTAAPGPAVGPVARHVSPCRPGNNIVPWDPQYNTGVIPHGIESCLAAQIGPTFLNPFYQDGPKDGLGSCWGCALTIAKELPCIATAIETEDISVLLGCGVDKPDVCNCLSCLPDSVYKYMANWCSSLEGNGIPATDEYSDNNFVDNASDSVKAFLGLLKVEELEILRDNAAADSVPAPTSPNYGGGYAGGGGLNPGLGCILGSKCGSCDCCFGLCVFGACGGVCA